MTAFPAKHYSQVITRRERLDYLYAEFEKLPAFRSGVQIYEEFLVQLDQLELSTGEHNRIANQFSDENSILNMPILKKYTLNPRMSHMSYGVTTKQVIFTSETGAMAIYRKIAGCDVSDYYEYKKKGIVEYQKRDYLNKNVWNE